jgi:phosphatidylglycerol---prolipoprotein diacylglyceryl transferase
VSFFVIPAPYQVRGGNDKWNRENDEVISMLPWIESQTYNLGPLVLHTWGTFVAAGFIVGTIIASRRAKKLGLASQHVWDMAFWIFIAAMIGSRAFHVLFYEPAYYVSHPWEALDPRAPGYAIIGGFLSAAAVFTWYVRRHALSWIEYADALIWGLPVGCGIGRIGCFLIHDHPGTLTHFMLGVKYPDGQVRHDLGLYLSLLGFAIAILFVALDRRKRHAGFWFGLFLLVDGVSRFLLDFLRVIDRRVLGLTPTQWILIGTAGIGGWLVLRGRQAVQS